MPSRLGWLPCLTLVLSCSGFDRSWGDSADECGFLDPALAEDEDGDVYSKTGIRVDDRRSVRFTFDDLQW